ncbi:MAG: sigma-54 dependent transcriptional regulator [Desulfobacteraceae bacterium]|nr:sigma-54 dependent transcriptional regulator [Desulfobacteraceae bacterium]
MSPTAPAAGNARIFVIDDEVITVKRLTHALGQDGYAVEGFVTAREALQEVRKDPPAVIVMDVRLQDADGVDLMQRIHALAPATAIILITGYASIGQAVAATKKGAFQYLEKPFRLQDLREAIREALLQRQQEEQKDRLREELSRASRFGEIIGVAPAMRAVFKTIARVAPVDCNVVIIGESGTGKELVARSLHANSPRAGRPYVSFNCGAFSEELIANELFGHERGAFTGAMSTKLGLLETANGGTVFLDEIGEMPLAMQVKLLRVLQERTFMRVGGVKPLPLDVRLICATNRNIDKMIAAGELRQDFYYRLKVVTIELPPLRQRREDIPALAAHFVRKAAKRFGKEPPALVPAFLEALAAYPFPGNVRELENIIERAVALNENDTLDLDDLPPDLMLAGPEQAGGETTPLLKKLERDHIFEVYRETGYNQSETARRLGVSRTTLWRRLRDFHLPSRKERS